MNKRLNLMAVMVVTFLAGLAPVDAAQAAPYGQMRLPGNFSPRLTYVPGTVLNTQTQIRNFGGSLVSSQTIRSIGAIQAPRMPVVDRITQVAPPMVTLDATRYFPSVDGRVQRPSISLLYERASQTILGLSVINNSGNGADNDGGGSGGDGDDGGDDENGGGGKDGSGAGGNGSGPGYSPPKPPDLNYFYYVDDDDDEGEFMGRMHTIIRMYGSQVK